MTGLIDTGGGDAAGLVREGNVETFADDVIEASKTHPVVLEFYSPRSELSRTLSHDLEQLVLAAKGEITLVRFDVHENPQVAQQLQVQTIPTVYAFVDGQPVDGFAGPANDTQLRAFVEKLAGAVQPSEAEDLVATGVGALEAGDADAAAQAFSAALQNDPLNVEALAGLARSLLALNREDDARQVLDSVPEEYAEHTAIRSVRASLALAEGTGDAGDVDRLRAQVDASPRDPQARFDLGIALVAEGRHEEAIDELLEIVRTNATWNDEAARKKVLEIFIALGSEDPATIEGRRKLSTVIFS